MTGIEWAVVLLATAICLLGAVLPMLASSMSPDSSRCCSFFTCCDRARSIKVCAMGRLP